MAREKRDRTEIVMGDGIIHRDRVAEIAPSWRTVIVSRVTKFIWIFVSIIDILLALRFILVAINANASSGFVNFIYTSTYALALPFQNIVNVTGFDVGAIIAIFVYTIIASIIIALFQLAFADTNGLKSSSQLDVIE